MSDQPASNPGGRGRRPNPVARRASASLRAAHHAVDSTRRVIERLGEDASPDVVASLQNDLAVMTEVLERIATTLVDLGGAPLPPRPPVPPGPNPPNPRRP